MNIPLVAPCVTVAFTTREKANGYRRSVNRRGIICSVSYCSKCDEYHVTARSDTVSDRELKILRMLAQGYKNTEIGAAVGATYRYVDNTIQRLMRRFYALNTKNLIATTMHLGLFSGTDFVPIVTNKEHHE